MSDDSELKVLKLEGQILDLRIQLETMRMKNRESLCNLQAPLENPRPKTYNMRNPNEVYRYLKDHMPEWFNWSNTEKQKYLDALPPVLTINVKLPKPQARRSGPASGVSHQPGIDHTVTIPPGDLP